MNECNIGRLYFYFGGNFNEDDYMSVFIGEYRYENTKIYIENAYEQIVLGLNTALNKSIKLNLAANSACNAK